MKRFEYRTPRYLANLPVLLRVENASIGGRCIEFGKEGMRVELERPVSAEARGSVKISCQDFTFELGVQVTRAGEDDYGLRFLFEAEQDRTTADRLVSMLMGSSGQPGPVLVR
jgi:hypothetical protein